jgi:hypothetical protein
MTGFRIAELLSLRVGYVWQHGQFLERVAVLHRYMKGKTEGRGVILHAEAKAALAPWLREMNRKEGVSTLSGKGRWHKGTIGNLLAQAKVL